MFRDDQVAVASATDVDESLTEAIVAELETVEAETGNLRPETVVEYAREHTDGVLHYQFEWSDTEAARQYRLEQARRVLRVRVTMQAPDGYEQQVRAFVSLPQDRGGENHGYRPLKAVLASEALRDLLLAEAKREMLGFIAKYRTLEELAEVRSTMQQVLDL